MESSVTAETARAGLALDSATLCEAFQRTAEAHAQEPALRAFGGSGELTWEQYAERVRRVAAGLRAAGVRRGDTVAIMLANRPETVIVDTAAMHLGAIPFSIYNTSSEE
ncbi:MAG TPA: AMP-binding protein, partial [Solirubrobacteraceae bacterium]